MTFCGIIRHNMYKFLPSKCSSLCIRNRLQEDMFQRSYNKLNKELNIVHFIKQVRVMKAAI